MENTEPEKNSPYSITVRSGPLGIIAAERELLFLLKDFNCYPPNRVKPLILSDPDGHFPSKKDGEKLHRMLKRLLSAREALEGWLGKRFIAGFDWGTFSGQLEAFQRICDLAGNPTFIAPYSDEFPTVMALKLNPIGMKRHDHLWQSISRANRAKWAQEYRNRQRGVYFAHMERARKSGLEAGRGRKAGGTTYLP